MLGDFFLDLTQDPAIRAEVGDHFPSFVKNNTVGGKLVAMPWFIDAGVLYYRSDLLARYGLGVPQTWEDLTLAARKIQKGERARGESRFWGLVFEARAYEGLTCNALEWIHGNGGGSIVDPTGKITVDNPRAAQALALAASWVNDIAPPGVLNYMEEEARGVFESGNAAFMRNWPYALKLAAAPESPVRGKVGVALIPKGAGEGASHSATLGGWSLAVSKYSRQKSAAVSLVAWLTRPEEQKRRALALGQNPTVQALYHDSDLLRDNPALPLLLRAFEGTVARPSSIIGPAYNRVSSEFWDTVHRILSKEGIASDELHQLHQRLLFISRKEKG
jgi:trehalose/maltose transport system substrate-binding protein